jgi:hypothetical protein
MIRDTASVNYFEDHLGPSVLSSGRALLAESADVAKETADLRVANAQLNVWLAGFHNHLTPGIIRFYQAIAVAAGMRATASISVR